jgi:hypothetical protein
VIVALLEGLKTLYRQIHMRAKCDLLNICAGLMSVGAFFVFNRCITLATLLIERHRHITVPEYPIESGFVNRLEFQGLILRNVRLLDNFSWGFIVCIVLCWFFNDIRLCKFVAAAGFLFLTLRMLAIIDVGTGYLF